MSVKFGIIGFGFIGQIHEEMINGQLEGAEVAAICDIVPKRMEQATAPGIQKFVSADELLAVEELEVVIISVPNHLHKEMVIKAARAGKDIICEKPAAMSVSDLDEMLREVDRNHVRFTVHHQRRFDKGFRTIKRAYDDGLAGRPYTVQSKLYGFNGNMHDWHVYKKYGGGMLFDWGVHLIDQILWMMKCKVRTVYADVRNVINFEVDDYFKVLLRFENEVTAEIELGTYFLKNTDNWFCHHWFLGGDKGTVYCDGFAPEKCEFVTTNWLLESVSDGLTMTKAGPTRSFGNPTEGLLRVEEVEVARTGYIDYYRNYMAAREGKEAFLVRPEEVRYGLLILEAVRESARTGETVRLSGE